MYDLARCHFPSHRQLGFLKAYELAKLPSKAMLESSSPEHIRNEAKRHPLFYFPTYEADVGAVKAVADGKGAFVISVSDLLASSGAQRGILISKMRNFLQLCVKYRAGYVICSLAKEEFGTRSARELVANGELLGLSYEQAVAAVKRLAEILGGEEGGR